MKSFIIICTVLGSFFFSQLQLNTEKSTLKIIGTSSLHDWEMVVEKFDATGEISETQIQNLEVQIEAKSMKSGKSIMDNKAYDAVQADDYSIIRFSAKTLTIEGTKILGVGELEIAEKRNEVTFSADIIHNESAEMRLQGELPLKMTDFNIDPPTAMFGTLKTGDEVVISYDIFITK